MQIEILGRDFQKLPLRKIAYAVLALPQSRCLNIDVMVEVLVAILDHKKKVPTPRHRITESWKEPKSLMTIELL